MSGAGQRCASCGSANIVQDELYAEQQQVCADCGSVESAVVLAQDPAGGSDVSYRRTTAVAKQLCANLIKGLERVKEIGRLLRVRSEIEELASKYFKQAYEHEDFIRVSLEKKEVLAGCCVLVSCRQLNWPITMGTISCLLSADQALVGAVHQQMVKSLDIQAPTTNITDIMEGHCQEYKLSPSQVREEFAEDSKALTKQAMALVELAADSWIVTGRRPLPIMMSAVYLAWQSLNPNKDRLKLSLDKFCNIAKVQKHNPASKRISELKEVLCKLGKEIPWIRERLTHDNIIQHVGDILQHRYALLRRALRAHEVSLQADSQITCGNPSAGEKPPSQSSDCVDQTPDASMEQQCSNEEREPQVGDGDETPVPEESDSHSQDQAPDWRKRVLFAPPCVNRPKRKRAERPELIVTGDEEISDSEIDSYIRTPQEAQIFALSQKMFASSDSGKS
ncbi:transcription factor IIIB 50 kDa subunit [Cololabis saira]|uniref:transcription factor IIIB 50 kDa subunit n=1 Tax=Cololabis saira TaxID=129043 RepID=UPI002AD5A40A|nr:transcription factor IIIB 50 kDa subunit [Cololabis saira]